jgi:broad specificity phosphatase PhoE
MPLIHLVRHGQASFGSRNYDRLSETGHRQARITANHFFALGCRFEAVFCGSLRRQRDTAAALLDRFDRGGKPLPEPESSVLFDEYDATAVWERLLPQVLQRHPELEAEVAKLPADKQAFQRLFARVMDRWISGASMPEGTETWSAFQQRARRALDQLAAGMQGKKEGILFSSGGTIAALIQAATGLPDGKTLMLSWRLMNASISRLHVGRDGMNLDGFNNVTHLALAGEPALLTYR